MAETHLAKTVDSFIETFANKVYSDRRRCARCGAEATRYRLAGAEHPLLYIMSHGVVVTQEIQCTKCKTTCVLTSDDSVHGDDFEEFRMEIRGRDFNRCLSTIAHFEVLRDLMQLLEVAAIENAQERLRKHREIAKFMIHNARRVCEEWCRDEHADLRRKKYLQLYRETHFTSPLKRNLARETSDDYAEMYGMMEKSFSNNEDKILCLLDVIWSTLIDKPKAPEFLSWVLWVMKHVDSFGEFTKHNRNHDGLNQQCDELEKRLEDLELLTSIKKIPVVFMLFEIPRFFHFMEFVADRSRGGSRAPWRLTSADKVALAEARQEVERGVRRRWMTTPTNKSSSSSAPIRITNVYKAGSPDDESIVVKVTEGVPDGEHQPVMMTRDEYISQYKEQIKTQSQPSLPQEYVSNPVKASKTVSSKSNNQESHSNKSSTLKPSPPVSNPKLPSPPLPEKRSGPDSLPVTTPTTITSTIKQPQSTTASSNASSSAPSSHHSTNTSSTIKPPLRQQLKPSNVPSSNKTVANHTSPPDVPVCGAREEVVDWMRFIVAEADRASLRRWRPYICQFDEPGVALVVASEFGKVEHIILDVNDIAKAREYLCTKYEIFVPPEGHEFDDFVRGGKLFEGAIANATEEELRLLMMSSDRLTQRKAKERFEQLSEPKEEPKEEPASKADLRKKLRSSMMKYKQKTSTRGIAFPSVAKSPGPKGFLVPTTKYKEDLSDIPFTTNWTLRMMDYLDEYIRKGLKASKLRSQEGIYDTELQEDLEVISSLGPPMIVARLSILELYRYALKTDADEAWQKYTEEKKVRVMEALKKQEANKQKRLKRDEELTTNTKCSSGQRTVTSSISGTSGPKIKETSVSTTVTEKGIKKKQNKNTEVNKDSKTNINCDTEDDRKILASQNGTWKEISQQQGSKEISVPPLQQEGSKEINVPPLQQEGSKEITNIPPLQQEGSKEITNIPPLQQEGSKEINVRPAQQYGLNTPQQEGIDGGYRTNSKSMNVLCEINDQHKGGGDRADEQEPLNIIRDAHASLEPTSNNESVPVLQCHVVGSTINAPATPAESIKEGQCHAVDHQSNVSSAAMSLEGLDGKTPSESFSTEYHASVDTDNSLVGPSNGTTTNLHAASALPNSEQAGSSPQLCNKTRRKARDMFKICDNCLSSITNKIMVCSGCRRVAYCTSLCQKEHWKKHKQLCLYHYKKDITG